MDITICKGEGCPLKERCHRYTCKRDDLYQSYFTESPNEGDKCEYFWGNKDSHIRVFIDDNDFNTNK